MREVDKLYLIDQGVVFFCEGFDAMVAGSLNDEFDEATLMSIEGKTLKHLANHFRVSVEPRNESRWKDGEKVGTYRVGMEESVFPLVKHRYQEHTEHVNNRGPHRRQRASRPDNLP